MRRMWLLLMLLGVFTAGCVGERPATDTETGVAEEGVVPRETALIEETDEPSLLGSSVLSLAGDEEATDRDEFTVGDSIVLTVTVLEVPPKLAAWVEWLGPEDQRIAKEQKPVEEDRIVRFEANTAGWPAGFYEAEVYLGGDLAGIERFRLEAPAD